MKIKQYILLIMVVLLHIPVLVAQQESLPKRLTETESVLIQDFEFKSSALVNAPDGPVRAAAEWEEVAYLVLSWDDRHKNIQLQVVQAAIKECKVFIVAANASSVKSYLSSKGVDMSKVIVKQGRRDALWIRDYGGNTVYSDDVGTLGLTDWIYNRPRKNDDKTPAIHAKEFNIPLYETATGKDDLVNTGGNYMSDGLGNAFASELILEENEAGNPYGVSAKTEKEIDAIMKRYMGITNYIKMPVLPYDEIHHIDMHMKLLDEETLLVSQYPKGVADGPQIEKNLQYVLDNFKSPFGTPYRIFRVDSPKDKRGNYPDRRGSYCTYANATFVNKSILIPIYRPEVDKPALELYRKLLPGYTIVGIDVDNSEDLISKGGAIHCITHTIGVKDPLWIVHQPVRTSTSQKSIAIKAMIKHNSGIKSAQVLWRKKGDTDFKSLPMKVAKDADFLANLPVEASAYDIEYYIEATANSGKTLARPIVAPKGFWTVKSNPLSLQSWADQQISAPFPNPTRQQVTFNLGQLSSDVTVSIYSTLGKKLYENTVVKGSNNLSLTLNNDWTGVLYVVFKGAFGEVNRKIVKF